MNKRSTHLDNDSFPFMGLLTFILAVAIIAGAMGFVFYKRRQARMSMVRSEISVLNGALSTYIATCDGPPTPAQGLSALTRNPGVSGWSGPYVVTYRGLKDPWHTPYRYQIIGGSPVVSSAGPDGVFGTPDDL